MPLSVRDLRDQFDTSAQQIIVLHSLLVDMIAAYGTLAEGHQGHGIDLLSLDEVRDGATLIAEIDGEWHQFHGVLSLSSMTGVGMGTITLPPASV